MNHITVLLKETVDALGLKGGETIVDATLGGGGHSEEILERLPDVKVIGFELDRHAIESATKKLSRFGERFSVINENFSSIDESLERAGVSVVDGFVFDLGVSSYQIDASGRGFSFLRNEPLTMTLSDDPLKITVTAREVVNEWSEETLADIIFGFGEERFARRIARRIIEERTVHPIETSLELAELVSKAIPARFHPKRIHPATKTFQAIRMAVNAELTVIEKGLEGAWNKLKHDGVIAVISFHSLEDRIVKRFAKAKDEAGEASIVTKRPLGPGDEEIMRNPRSRSAKLRIFRKK
jgi:16S rRNA (cytosine1402-N4)-methyltransferase